MNKENVKKADIKLEAFIVFAVLIVLVCGIVFLFSYEMAYDWSDQGYPGPAYGVVICYFLIAGLFALAAGVLKLVFRDRVSLGALLSAAFLVPLVCYLFNYHTLKKDGMLYFLVDDGGIFSFATSGDLNFNGKHDAFEGVSISSDFDFTNTEYADDRDGAIRRVDLTASGTGHDYLSTSCKPDWKTDSLCLRMYTLCTFDRIVLDITLKNPDNASKIAFYIDGTKLDHTVNPDGTVTITFDAEDCSRMLEDEESNYKNIQILYFVEG